jgi:hypothetical protein
MMEADPVISGLNTLEDDFDVLMIKVMGLCILVVLGWLPR